MLFLLLLIELIGLAFVTRRLQQKFYAFCLLVFQARSVALSITTVFLFPGTVIHELSHLFTAEILGVHTGKLTLVPENIRGEHIQAGSVAVAQTDPFRRALIGLAPLLVGIVTVTGLSYVLIEVVSGNRAFSFLEQYSNVAIIIILYFLFTISGSMFPSGPDFKGTPALGITMGLFLLAGYLVGFRFGLTGEALRLVGYVTESLAKSLGIILALNLIGLLMIHVLIVLAGKITHRKIV